MKRQRGIERKPEGLQYKPDILDESEEKEIIRNLEALSFTHFKMHGIVAKREVVHFGYDYLYDQRKITPTVPLPGFLKPYLERAAGYADISPDILQEILVTRYGLGSGIGWHKDAPAFGSPVIGISLKSSCMMKFRRKIGESYEVYSLELCPRSLYIMNGESRSQWQHHIAETKDLRYSITFRTLKAVKVPESV
jgi:alkylated DNA repair protein (DNA oxidative demethylase)